MLKNITTNDFGAVVELTSFVSIGSDSILEWFIFILAEIILGTSPGKMILFYSGMILFPF